jgi:hypothetical protein
MEKLARAFIPAVLSVAWELVIRQVNGGSTIEAFVAAIHPGIDSR